MIEKEGFCSVGLIGYRKKGHEGCSGGDFVPASSCPVFPHSECVARWNTNGQAYCGNWILSIRNVQGLIQ